MIGSPTASNSTLPHAQRETNFCFVVAMNSTAFDKYAIIANYHPCQFREIDGFTPQAVVFP